MGVLLKTKCYLVGPIEACPSGGKGWRDVAKEELEKIGVISYDPISKPFVKDFNEDARLQKQLKTLRAEGRYDELAVLMKEIRIYDLNLVDRCDFILAHFDNDVLTCGSFEEVFWANRLKKPIFFVQKGGKQTLPLWWFGTFPHKYVYPTLESALDTLKGIDSGKISIDSSRWRLLTLENR